MSLHAAPLDQVCCTHLTHRAMQPLLHFSAALLCCTSLLHLPPKLDKPHRLYVQELPAALEYVQSARIHMKVGDVLEILKYPLKEKLPAATKTYNVSSTFALESCPQWKYLVKIAGNRDGNFTNVHWMLVNSFGYFSLFFPFLPFRPKRTSGTRQDKRLWHIVIDTWSDK